jgi:tetratricopeptide (TPR) repeat protein
MLDLFISNAPISVEGRDATGYRLRVQTPAGAGERAQVVFVTREDGQYKILDFGGGSTTLGSEVLDRVESGDLAGARHWLDWAREGMPLHGGEDPFAGPPFPRFWERGAQGDKDVIRYAAASLLAEGEKTEVERAIPILQEGRTKAASDAERLRFDLALARAFLKLERYGEVLPFSQRLLETAPSSDAAFVITMSALRGLKRWPEYEHCAQDRLKRLPDDLLATRLLADGASRHGELAAAIQLEQRMVSLGKADSADYNQIAWFTLIEGSVTNQTIEDSQRGNYLSKNANPSELHTLAALYAEVGKTTEARDTLLRSMELRGLEEPDPDYWYVFGRIAEQFGVRDAAVADYRKLKPPDKEKALGTSTYALAQRRLAILEGEKGK